MVLSQFAFGGSFDSSRVAAQVVSGMGFIGAGTIIFQRNAVRGLTTAAGIWVAAAIGLTCGAGMYPLAGAATVMVLIVLEAMHFIQHRDANVSLVWSSGDREAMMASLDALRARRIHIVTYTLKEDRDAGGGVRYCATAELKMRDDFPLRSLTALLDSVEGVRLESISG